MHVSITRQHVTITQAVALAVESVCASVSMLRPVIRSENVLPSVLRSIRYALSLVALSVQARSSCEVEMEETERPVGAAGRVQLSPAAARESPPALKTGGNGVKLANQDKVNPLWVHQEG